MVNLLDAIQIIQPEGDEEPEDIFASAPGLIFWDDLRNHHGDPGSTIIYKSPRFGDIQLKTADPTGEAERQLFSHYLWNAGIKLAGLISDQHSLEWCVEGETVLELGAGVGLVGIVATLAGAERVSLSDYPAPEVLANARQNAGGAIPANLEDRYQIVGHEWGVFDADFAINHKHSFTRILAADCLWMSSRHSNLVRSMLHFLTLHEDGRVFVTAGFHTGRAKVAEFFDAVQEEGLLIAEIYEEDAAGLRREWMKERDGGTEDTTARKRWLVIARLVRSRP